MVEHEDCVGRECGTWEQCTGTPCVPRENARQEMTVTLFVTRYNELVEAELKLRALEDAGVDNWEWYDEAMRNKVEIKDGPRQVFIK